MNKEQIKALDNLQADLISPEEEATLDPPAHDENRVLRGNMVWKNWHSQD